MKTPMALSVTSSQREQTFLGSQVPRLPRSNVCSTRDRENPSASVHRRRFSTRSFTHKVLCAGQLNPRFEKQAAYARSPGLPRKSSFSNLSFLGPNRMDNLLKDHTWLSRT